MDLGGVGERLSVEVNGNVHAIRKNRSLAPADKNQVALDSVDSRCMGVDCLTRNAKVIRDAFRGWKAFPRVRGCD